MLIETYGVDNAPENTSGNLHVPAPGEVYPHDRFVYWQFSSGALTNLLKFTELSSFELHSTPMIDGHPRIIGVVRKAA